MKKYSIFAVLLAALLFLSGCTSSVPIRKAGQVTLPPVSLEVTAPVGDTGESLTEAVLFSLPNAQSGQLEYVSERILLSNTRHPAEYAIRRLFTYPGTTQVKALTDQAQLSLNPGSSVELSGDTATVNLAPSALSLSNQERYLVSRAITNTLTQWGDIKYVNILINSRHPGLDTAATLPLGALTRSQDGDVAALWENADRVSASQSGPFSAIATLYYPVSAGRGILAESRLITAKEKNLSQLAQSLLQALSIKPDNLPNTLAVPDLTILLAQAPVIVESAGSTGRIVRLHFQESMNEALIAAGIPRSVMMASLTYTLTTFLPYTSGVSVTIGDEEVTAVVPAGLYEGAGEEIVFDKGVMQRTQFERFLLNHCSLYFRNAQNGLTETLRPVPYYQASSLRYLINQLIQGPKNTDSVTGLSPVLPDHLNDADLLGITRKNDTALVHFSENLRTEAKAYTDQDELIMVYAMVNTLTKTLGTDQVCFFINNSQEGMFANRLDLAGVFLRNEGIISKNGL
ncbi:MAG: GerMN domain-containing protein [Bacillota bacterium]|nr:GerMN domain-containing protein [Bacillota bacterium]